jgi:hypothetical protein
MKTTLLGWIGSAVLAGAALWMNAPARGGDSGGRKEADGKATCEACGCRLVAVCHVTCTTKTVTEYKYSRACDYMCVPGVTSVCRRLDGCDGCPKCRQEGCDGRCTVRSVNKLVKHAVTKEVPVRKCTVEWVCPKCGEP